MIQFKNYLSGRKHHTVKNALLLGTTEEFQTLIPYLIKYEQVQKIYYVASNVEELPYEAYENRIFRCSETDLPGITDQLDLLIFDRNRAELVRTLAAAAPSCLMGRTADTEDCFTIWETFRDTASSIYIETTEDILEWERPETGIELSVIVPVYNVSEYLPRCVETLTAWQADYVEYLFVDDGSSDRSTEMIEAYASRDRRIRLIRKENGGCASARNLGIEEARGTYTGFVDADDFVDETMYYKLLRRAMTGNYDLTYCGYLEYDETTGNTQPAQNDCLQEPYLSGTRRTGQIQLLTVNTRVAVWRCLYRKSVLEEAQIRFHEDLKRFDDLPFRVEYILAAKSAVCVPEHLYYYRLGRNGQDVSCTDRRLYVHFDIFDHLDACAEKYKDRRIWDLLQIVKIHTHRYALSRIEDVYRDDYIRRAKSQIRMHGGYFRNICLILMHAGKSNAVWLTRLWLHK